MSDDAFERREADAAAAEAGAIGGTPSTEEDGLSEAERPLVEAGEGESEGFEQSERLLEDHASHGDQHAARHVIGDAGESDEDARAAPGGDADSEYSSERDAEATDR